MRRRQPPERKENVPKVSSFPLLMCLGLLRSRGDASGREKRPGTNGDREKSGRLLRPGQKKAVEGLVRRTQTLSLEHLDFLRLVLLLLCRTAKKKRRKISHHARTERSFSSLFLSLTTQRR